MLYGDYRQFFTQVGGATFMALYIFAFTYVVFSLVNVVRPLRVPNDVELEGLDVPEFGLPAYPEDSVEILAPGGQVEPARA